MTIRYRTPNLAVIFFLFVYIAILPPFGSAQESGTPAALTTETSAALYDLVIYNGRVIDPETGRDEIASVGIKNGVIVKIAPGANSLLGVKDGDCQFVDATGLVVSPGFINTHTHESYLSETSRIIVQDGITFWLGGNCGGSSNHGTDMGMSEWLDWAEGQELYNNFAPMSGHNTLRLAVGLGGNDHETAEQTARMVEIFKDDLEAGAFGVSFGPYYNQGATKKAMIELGKASKAAGGMAASHTRMMTLDLLNVFFPYKGEPFTPRFDRANKSNIILFADSIREAIDTCREAEVPFIISHLTAMTYNGSMGWVLDSIQKAIEKEGLPIAADNIGYDTMGTELLQLALGGTVRVKTLLKFFGATPDQFHMQEDVFVDGKLYMKEYERFTSAKQIQDLVTAFKEGRGSGRPDSDHPTNVRIWHDTVAPVDTMQTLKRPFVFMGDDALLSHHGITGETDFHPQVLSTFSRLLGHWSREMGALSMKEALFKSTIAPALWLGLEKKGRLQEGCDADITLFNPDTIIDRAKVEAGKLYLPPAGIDFVIVNGQVVLDHGVFTGKIPGKVIRRTWEIPGNSREVLSVYDKLFPKPSLK